MSPPLPRPFRRRSRLLGEARDALRDVRGLEVGGPSRIFSAKGRLPIYPVLAALDGCDYRPATVWCKEARSDYAWDPKRPAGRFLLCEAGTLAGVPARAYGALLASHVLEHLADPLGALASWRRVLEPGGTLVLVVPHRDGTFDHRRPVTTLEHLAHDFDRQTGEDDATHRPEILAHHDLSRDPGAGSREAFEARCRDNVRHRAMHHHVFDTRLAVAAVDRAGFALRGVQAMQPYHVILLARAPAEGEPVDNAPFLTRDAACLRRSPFPSDR